MISKWFFLMFLYQFGLCTSDDAKSSLTFVIDDTGSMGDDIDEVKLRASDIFDAVLKSEDSQIENFILVTFNDPDVKLRTVTRERHIFKEKLAEINVHGGGDCPEYAMSGIELALKESLPNSYLYVFTDASAYDYKIHDRVKSLAESKSCQIVFVLTGMCGSYTDADYNVYVTLAKVTNGQVFHMGKSDVKDIINYVVESVKGRRNIVATKEFSPGYGHTFTFPVDSAIDDVIISVSGKKPMVAVKDEKGLSPKAEPLVDLDKISVVKLIKPSPGNYTAEVGSETKTSAVVSAKTTLNFQYGFSTFKPSSLNDTATRPPPDGKSFLMIKLNVGKKESVIVELKTVKILNLDEAVVRELPLEIVDEEQKLYITEPFETPKTLFKIMVIGVDTKTNTTISRTSSTSIEPQNPAIEIKENKAPTISIDGEPKINVEYDEPFALKCKVNAYPKPVITWKDKSTGTILLTTVSDVELPYKYIGIFNIEKVNSNGTYECSVSNAFGVVTKIIEIETKRKIYFNPIQVPKDTKIEYKQKGVVTCTVDAYPPANIAWYKNDEELHSNDEFTISSDGSELIITNMQTYQRGLYKCVAKNEYEENVYSFNITITGVEAPKIDKHVHEMNVTRGTDVDILCRVTKGIPEPKIIWFHKKSTTDIFIKLDITGQKLHIKNTQDNRSGLYKCKAVSVMGTDCHDIDVNVQYSPMMKYKHDFISANDGEEVTLTCEVEGMPKPNVQWFKDDKAFEITSSMHLYRDHSLRFKVALADRGLYSCKAENHLGSEKKLILLEVYVPVTITPPEVSTIDVKVGDEFHLPCEASGYPKPNIKWIHYNNDPSVPPKTIRTKNSTLSLSHVQLNMAGYYTCIASNIATSYNISYLVRVLAPPIIENIYPDKTFKVVEGDLVLRIACKVTGSPEPVITWKRDGRNIALGTEWYDKDEDGALIIKNIDTKSEGSYTCEAVNILGYDTEVYTVEVAPYPKQESPRVTQLVEEGTSADIKCHVPHEPLDLLRWYKNNKLLTVGELKLRDAKLSDTEVYTCRVSTFSGSTSSDTLVRVGYKPKFTSDEEEVYELDETWSQTFICDAMAEPPAKVTWWHNDRRINVTDMFYTFHAEFNKRGKYFCEVTNEFGTINRTFYLQLSDCIIDIKKDLKGNQPIMIGSPYKWPQYETADGYIRIPKGEYFRLICPKTFTHFPKNYITAFCDGETSFTVNGHSYKYSDFKCTEAMEPKIQRTGQSCFHGDTEWITIGFENFDQLLTVYSVCWDRKNNVPIYTKHNLDRYLAEVEPETSKWVSGDLPFKFEEMYDCGNQTTAISDDLNRWFHDDDKCCFTKRQLVNPRDVQPGLAQVATYNYINVVPHWSSCDTRNWEEVETRLRTLVKSIDYPLTVWTGTSKLLELPNADSAMTEIRISDSTWESQPVSQYLWKVVQDGVTKSSLAIIQINIPDLSPSDLEKHILCKDICENIRWIRNPDWHDIDKGYTYCCSLLEFERMFKISGIFNRGHYHVLYDVPELSERSLII